MRIMSKKKFGLLLGFMLFSILTLITVVVIEVNHYLVIKDIESNPNDKSQIINDTPEKQESDVLPNEEEDLTEASNKEEDIDIKDEIPKEEPSKSDISLLFAGDVLLSNHHLCLFDKKNSNIHGILSKELVDIMNSVDVMMINQEFPFSNRGTKMEDKQYTFRVDPNRVNILLKMGVDIVTLANNHTLDFGTDALLDTIDTLDNTKLKHVGAGRDLEDAKLTNSFEINNKKIAFLGASRVIPVYEWNAMKEKPGLFTTYDPTLLIEEIKAAKNDNDIVVVYVHWGIERAEYPEDYQRNLGKQYIDAGADIVIGSHPHVLQGIEYYKGKPIVYSLGNFIFGTSNFSTMLFRVDINPENAITISLIPCQSNNGYTIQKDKKQWIEFYQYMEQISFNVIIDEDGVIKSKE